MDIEKLKGDIKDTLEEYDEARNIACMDGADEELAQTEIIVVERFVSLIQQYTASILQKKLKLPECPFLNTMDHDCPTCLYCRMLQQVKELNPDFEVE